MTKLPSASLLLLALAACAPAVPRLAPIELTEQEARGYSFAKANCAGCHAITANAASPNVESPDFQAVANMPGLTRETLRNFLRDSHNYPAAMNFTVEPGQVEDLTAYVLTLRKADYKPEI
ncbi:c-type cytochrome [Novosphingobium sp. NPDC080210]|uniref:c-type cytochrome n=1 Tax=Novosphingobium sp. NPDC080210 TaxID=3390596 RepID=UPI003D0400AD